MPCSKEYWLCVAKAKISLDLAPIYGLQVNPDRDRGLHTTAETGNGQL